MRKNTKKRGGLAAVPEFELYTGKRERNLQRDQLLVLPDRNIKNAIMPIIATTIKIPTPMPALKIPSITLQELNKVVISSKTDKVLRLKFFMALFFLNDCSI